MTKQDKIELLPCAYCKEMFTPVNQVHECCSEKCRIKRGNAVTKARYHAYKEVESLQEENKRLRERVEVVRIMATNAFLDQDGRSIIAASDFKEIEIALEQALKDR